MDTIRVGQIYPFEVVTIREENERKYIYLSNGAKDTFRVTPYDYQLEWEGANLPDKLECYVKSINIWGLPQLIQSRKNVLADCYTEENTEYAFKVVGVKEDANNGATYYDIKDAFGLHHRYYPQEDEPIQGIGDIFSLLFEGIEVKERNNAYLKLKSVVPKKASTSYTITSEPSTTENDPRTESAFGYENEYREFKSSIVFPAGNITDDIDKQLLIIAKTIAGFQNNEGGELYIGINDSGEVIGIQYDFKYLNKSENDSFIYQSNKDGYENKIRTAVKYFLGNTANSNISFSFDSLNELEYCLIKIKKVQKPIFLHNTKLYQRAGNMTQLLKGDEITYFIEERFISRNKSMVPQYQVEEPELEEVNEEAVEYSHDNGEDQENTSNTPSVPGEEKKIAYPEKGLDEKDEGEMVSQATHPEVQIPEINKPDNQDKIWFYLTFYKNGGWSYSKRPVNTIEVEFELPIMDSLKMERLLMVYDNGCVNVVTPYDIIKPRGVKGRKFRIKDKVYLNGWNTKAKLLDVICAKRNDLIVFDSIDTNGTRWIKAHNVSAISVHSSLQLEGNVLVNNKKFQAKLEKVSLLPLETYHLISSLVLKDSQTSGYLGVKTTDKSYQKTFKTLQKLVEGYKKVWEN